MAHIFTGSLTTRDPAQFGTSAGWYHVVCYADQRTCVGVATDRETLAAGGGDRLYPGSCLDLYGIDGIWLAPPSVGAVPIVSIEQRSAPSFLTVDPEGEKSSFSQFKGMHPRKLEPGQWYTIASNIIGMTEWLLRVDGGTVVIESHCDPKLPPHQQPDTTGGGWEIRPTDPPLLVPGNQNLYAFTYEPQGVMLRMAKITRGADIVVRPK